MRARFLRRPTPLAGVEVLERVPIKDERGYLERLYCASELGTLTAGRPVLQINHSLTHRQGTLRGMHFQLPPHAEIKLVTCLRGEIYDVAVDLRRGSPTFLHWHAEILSPESHRALVIPEGLAHGFQTLVDDCELLYLHTAAYRPEAEAGVDALDPRLAIEWPLAVVDRSDRDRGHPPLSADFRGLSV